MHIEIETGGASRLGQKAMQQDRFALHSGLVGVFDGVSTLHGEFASRLAVRSEHLRTLLRAPFDSEALHTALVATNNEIVSAAADQGFAAATTACLAHFDGADGRWSICHIGDSSLNVIRQGKILFRTTPQLTDAGKLQRALGARKLDASSSGFDRCVIEVKPGDVLLLHTDGLRDALSEEEIVATVENQRQHGATAQETADSLVDLAMSRRVRDNVTAVVVHMKESAVPSFEPQKPTPLLEAETSSIRHGDANERLQTPVAEDINPCRSHSWLGMALAAFSGTLAAQAILTLPWQVIWMDVSSRPPFLYLGLTSCMASIALLILERRWHTRRVDEATRS